MNRSKHQSLEFWDKEENKNFNFEKLPSCSSCNQSLIISNLFNCKVCNLFFCSDHYLILNHQCINNNNDLNNNNNLITESVTLDHPKCYYNSCLIKMDLCNRFLCKYCNKTYCSSHRLDFVHDCKKIINNEFN